VCNTWCNLFHRHNLIQIVELGSETLSATRCGVRFRHFCKLLLNNVLNGSTPLHTRLINVMVFDSTAKRLMNVMMFELSAFVYFQALHWRCLPFSNARHSTKEVTRLVSVSTSRPNHSSSLARSSVELNSRPKYCANVCCHNLEMNDVSDAVRCDSCDHFTRRLLRVDCVFCVCLWSWVNEHISIAVWVLRNVRVSP